MISERRIIMHRSHRTVVAVALFLVSAPVARAQAPVDPSGHWEGSIQIPGSELTFEIDLAKNGKGEFAGTVNNPAERIKGLPLRTVVVEGRSISFDARRDQPMTGTLSADGKSISGDATLSGYVLPFSLTRTGDAEIVEPARSAPIDKELEGTWNGTLDANGTSMHFVLTMASQPDGSATARAISLDEGELEVPLVVTQKGSSVVLVNNVVPSSFAGVLNSERTELSGTFTQGSVDLPMTFRRAAAGKN
jgi:hypothetical protein